MLPRPILPYRLVLRLLGLSVPEMGGIDISSRSSRCIFFSSKA